MQWTRHSIGQRLKVRAVTYGCGRFVAVGDLGLVAVSADGVDWVRWQPARWIDLYSVAATDTCVVAAGASGILQFDWDGHCRSVWEHPSILTSVVQGSDRFVAAGYRHSMGQDTVLLTSSDGALWREVPPPPGIRHIDALTHGEPGFLAAGSDLALSTDGVNWRPVGDSALPGWSETALTWDGSRYLAVMGRGEVTLSCDGMTWTRKRRSVQSTGRSLAYGSGVYVMVGEHGTILTSVDGEAWGARRAAEEDLYGVAYGQGRFVAVGELGAVLVADLSIA